MSLRVAIGSIVASGLLILLGACKAAPERMESERMNAFVEMMMPESIEIERYLTKPIDLDNTGRYDGIELLLTARDALGDPIKCMGDFQFELHVARPASGDRTGKQLAFWPVQVNSADDTKDYWDGITRLYRFYLELDGDRVRAGRFVIAARLRLPNGITLFDEYEFDHSETGASSGS